jgi:hypothetical protein
MHNLIHGNPKKAIMMTFFSVLHLSSNPRWYILSLVLGWSNTLRSHFLHKLQLRYPQKPNVSLSGSVTQCEAKSQGDYARDKCSTVTKNLTVFFLFVVVHCGGSCSP